MLLLLYADDVVIFAETAEYLQMEIDKLHTYCNKWRLKVNASKSQVLVFKKGRVNSNESWYYGETQLTVATKISYLGLVFTTNGQNYQTQLALPEQANKAVFQLHKNISSFSYMPVSNILDLFDKLIVPILNYDSEVWGFHQAQDIERVHLSFCKRVLGVKKSTQNDFIYGLLGRMPMYLSRQLRIVKYWLKLWAAKNQCMWTWYITHVWRELTRIVQATGHTMLNSYYSDTVLAMFGLARVLMILMFFIMSSERD